MNSSHSPTLCLSSLLLPAVILRLASTAYTWGEGDGEVAVVIEKIGSNERVVSTTLQSNPMSALGIVMIHIHYDKQVYSLVVCVNYYNHNMENKSTNCKYACIILIEFFLPCNNDLPLSGTDVPLCIFWIFDA